MAEGGATAFVPGHVTGFFCPRWREDPARTGSIGAGLTLSDGVSVRIDPAETPQIELNGETVAMDAVERVIDGLGRSVSVTAESPLPLGTGFGVSGAMALGTALAINHRFGLARSENELVTVAHEAEVQAGTGLGDVVAQAHGGIPIRLAPGAPGHGGIDAIPTTTTLEYLTYGELDTQSVLRGDTSALESAGRRALSDLTERPTLPCLAEVSRRFGQATGLQTSRVTETIDDVLAVGGEAIMAMLGETVVSFGSGLSDAGYRPRRCSVHPPGATILNHPDGDQ